MALIAFMIDLALQSFDLLSQLQNQSILQQGLAPSCHSPACRAVMPFVSGLFPHFQRLPFSCRGDSTMHALLQPLLLLSFTTTSLYSKVTVFLIFTSVSLGFLMLHKRCIFSSSWQSSLLSFETCSFGSVMSYSGYLGHSMASTGHDSLVPCLVLYSNSKRQM